MITHDDLKPGVFVTFIHPDLKGLHCKILSTLDHKAYKVLNLANFDEIGIDLSSFDLPNTIKILSIQEAEKIMLEISKSFTKKNTDLQITLQHNQQQSVEYKRKMEKVLESAQLQMLSDGEIHHAAKLIEADGDEAYHTVKRKYGETVARILLIAHLRRSMGAMETFPAPPDLKDKVDEYLKIHVDR